MSVAAQKYHHEHDKLRAEILGARVALGLNKARGEETPVWIQRLAAMDDATFEVILGRRVGWKRMPSDAELAELEDGPLSTGAYLRALDRFQRDLTLLKLDILLKLRLGRDS